MEWNDESPSLKTLRDRVTKLQREHNGNTRISEIKIKRKSPYSMHAPNHKDESKNELYRGFGGINSDGYLMGSINNKGLNLLHELHDKELRLILEICNTEELLLALNPKHGVERKVENELESRLSAKRATIKEERELKDLKDTIEKEIINGLNEKERRELIEWREKVVKMQQAIHERLKGDWKDLVE